MMTPLRNGRLLLLLWHSCTAFQHVVSWNQRGVGFRAPFQRYSSHATAVTTPFQNATLAYASTQTQATTTPASSPFRVYCDLDGVLVDFEAGIRGLFPEVTTVTSFHIPQIERTHLWEKVQQARPAFFAHLPWKPDGRHLWQALQPLQPDILTGVPHHRSSRHEKVVWCQRELGVPVVHRDMAGRWRRHVATAPTTLRQSNDCCHVITCWSDNKHFESGPGAVLIDDRLCLKDAWEAKGGIFVHHETADKTLRQLRELGVLPNNDSKEEESLAVLP